VVELTVVVAVPDIARTGAIMVAKRPIELLNFIV
jgi:hypothetical protein